MDTRSASPILVYDGDCSLCQALARSFIFFRISSPEHIKRYDELRGDAAEAVSSAGIRNEMVALCERTNEARAGVDGMLWCIGSRLPRPVVTVLQQRMIKAGLTSLYRLISYNRRVVSPSRRRTACTCDPEYSPYYTISFVAVCVAIATAITGLFGAAVFLASGLGHALEGAAHMIGAAGLGWAILFVASFGMRGQDQVQYLAHLGATMVVGVMVLVPSILLSLIVSEKLIVLLFSLSVLISFTTMLRMQKKRIASLSLSGAWVLAWFVSLLAGAVAWGAWFLLVVRAGV